MKHQRSAYASDELLSIRASVVTTGLAIDVAVFAIIGCDQASDPSRRVGVSPRR